VNAVSASVALAELAACVPPHLAPAPNDRQPKMPWVTGLPQMSKFVGKQVDQVFLGAKHDTMQITQLRNAIPLMRFCERDGMSCPARDLNCNQWIFGKTIETAAIFAQNFFTYLGESAPGIALGGVNCYREIADPGGRTNRII